MSISTLYFTTLQPTLLELYNYYPSWNRWEEFHKGPPIRGSMQFEVPSYLVGYLGKFRYWSANNSSLNKLPTKNIRVLAWMSKVAFIYLTFISKF